MRTLDLKIGFPHSPNVSQARLLSSKAREILAMGPPGCGKSEGAYLMILAAAIAYPGNECCIGRAQLIDVKDHTVPHFWRIAPKELFTNWLPYEKFINKSPMVLQLWNGSRIQFTGFHESADAGSANWGAVLLQEVYSPLGGRGIRRDAYLGVDKALRCPAASHRFIIADTNQAPPDHWLHAEFGDNGRPGHEVVHFDWEENKHNLPEAHVAAIEAEWGSDPMLKGLLKPGWQEVISGTAVFGGIFEPSLHINEDLEPDPDEPMWRSWDPSFTQPWVTWNQLIDGKWCVFGEYLPKQVFLPELIHGVELYGTQHFPEARFRDDADHAVTQRKDTGVPIEIMRQHGISPRTTPTRPGGVRRGIEIMVDYMTRLRGKEPLFQIHPRCEATIQCLHHGYRWKQGRDDRLRDEPLKDGFYDNGADSLRYFSQNVLKGIVPSTQRPPAQQSFANYGAGVVASLGDEASFGSWN